MAKKGVRTKKGAVQAPRMVANMLNDAAQRHHGMAVWEEATSGLSFYLIKFCLQEPRSGLRRGFARGLR